MPCSGRLFIDLIALGTGGHTLWRGIRVAKHTSSNRGSGAGGSGDVVDVLGLRHVAGGVWDHLAEDLVQT